MVRRTGYITPNLQARFRGGMGKTAALDLSYTVVCAGQECIGISDSFVTVSDHIGPLVHCIFGFFLK